MWAVHGDGEVMVFLYYVLFDIPGLVNLAVDVTVDDREVLHSE